MSRECKHEKDPIGSISHYREGYVYRDRFGRVYIDQCESDHMHLTKPAEPGKERRALPPLRRRDV
jgi:hypothetical protein